MTMLPMPQQPQGGKAGGGKPGGAPQPQPLPVTRGPLEGGPKPKPALVGNQKPNQRLPGPGGKAGGGKPGGAPNPIMMGGPAMPRGGGGLTLADIQRPMPQVQNQQQITTPSGS